MGTVLIPTRPGTRVAFLPDERTPAATGRTVARRRKVGAALWVAQGLLALLFLFAGSMKLAVSPEALAAMTPLPVPFMRFIGLVEVLGGLGLVLPALTRVRPGLTSLAAAGLALEMIGATATTLAVGGGATALMPLVVGLLAVAVAYGRWRVAPRAARPGRSQGFAHADLISPPAR